MGKNENLLEVHDLRIYFYTLGGVVEALEGVNLRIGENDSLGVIGESGCGKTVTALSILRLIQSPPGKIEGGEIIFNGKDILKMSERQVREEIRGKEISMIFQEPVPALNPVIKVGRQLGEIFEYHERMNKKEASSKAIESLKSVGMPDPDHVANRYPHELSGGMAQRVMIAIALACRPKLIIADEPTTNLDVTVQGQILELIRDLMKETHTSLMMVAHDLGVIAETCEKVAVMYAGRVVEYADIGTIYKTPRHPYTVGLIAAIPNDKSTGELLTIEGYMPNLINPPKGCRFHPRCKYSKEICSKEIPPEIKIENGHSVACHLYA